MGGPFSSPHNVTTKVLCVEHDDEGPSGYLAARISIRSLPWEAHPEHRALAGLALDRDVTAHHLAKRDAGIDRSETTHSPARLLRLLSWRARRKSAHIVR
jgi:hypothetical protein